MIQEPGHDFGRQGVHFLPCEIHREFHGFGQTHSPAQPDNELRVNALLALHTGNFIPGNEV
jgi:hypothetical protein